MTWTADQAYTPATQSGRKEEIDPLSQHFVSETPLDETNITANTTDYAYFDMDGFSGLGLSGFTDGTTPTDVLTVTLEASRQSDGTVPASCAYADVTDEVTGESSFIDEDFEINIAKGQFPYKYFRLKYTTSNTGGNDADLTVYSKKVW